MTSERNIILLLKTKKMQWKQFMKKYHSQLILRTQVILMYNFIQLGLRTQADKKNSG